MSQDETSETETTASSQPRSGARRARKRPSIDVGTRVVARVRVDADFHNTLELAPPFCLSA